MSAASYVAATGAMAAGKTTVARTLARELGWMCLEEDFEANPFLTSFVRDPASCAFETELTFLLLHCSQLRSALRESRAPVIVSDFCLMQDLWYAELNLTSRELALFKSVYAHLSGLARQPDAVIVLHATTDLLMSRVAERNRSVEAGISRQYVESLNAQVERGARELPSSATVHVNMDASDILADPAAAEGLLRRVGCALRSRGPVSADGADNRPRHRSHLEE